MLACTDAVRSLFLVQALCSVSNTIVVLRRTGYRGTQRSSDVVMVFGLVTPHSGYMGNSRR